MSSRYNMNLLHCYTGGYAGWKQKWDSVLDNELCYAVSLLTSLAQRPVACAGRCQCSLRSNVWYHRQSTYTDDDFGTSSSWSKIIRRNANLLCVEKVKLKVDAGGIIAVCHKKQEVHECRQLWKICWSPVHSRLRWCSLHDISPLYLISIILILPKFSRNKVN